MPKSWFSNLSIRNKLLLRYALVLVAVACLSAVAMWSTTRLGRHVNTLATQTLPKQVQVSMLAQQLQAFRTLQYAHISALGPDEQKPIEANILAVQTNLPKVLAALKGSAETADERAKLEELNKIWSTCQAFFTKQILPDSQDALGNIAVRKMDGEHARQFERMQTLAGALMAQTATSAEHITAEGLAQAILSTRAVLGGSLAALTLGVVIAFVMARLLTAPIRRAVAIAQAVAQGDLTVHVDATSRDELGQLLEALNQMSQQLSGMVRGVREGTQFMSSACAEIVDLNTQQNAALVEQTASAGESLRLEAARLADSVAVFKLEESLSVPS